MRYFFIFLVTIFSVSYAYQISTLSSDGAKMIGINNSDIEQQFAEKQEMITDADETQTTANSTLPEDDKIGLSISFNPCYFWPQDKAFRLAYGDGGFSPLFEINYDFYKGFGVWTEVGYFHDDETVSVTMINTYKAKTKITLVPISLGFSYYYSVCSYFDVFIKAAPNLIWAKEEETFQGRTTSQTKNVFGGTFGLGGRFNFAEGWFVKLFVNYLYNPVTIRFQLLNQTYSDKEYVGGIQAGAGLGYTF